MPSTRRELLSAAGAALLWSRGKAQAGVQTKTMTLGFTTYGMPKLPAEKAIAAIAKIGFDSVEIDTAAGKDADAVTITKRKQQLIHEQLQQQKLRLTSLMAHITPTADESKGRQNLARVKATVDLARALDAEHPPLLQTVLGGGTWQVKRQMFVDRLGHWLEATAGSKVTIAVKPHRGGGMSRPSEAVWLFQQLGNPKRLRMVYDYSHYAHRQMSLKQTLETAIKYTAHVAVKDAVRTKTDKGFRVNFALPGASGTFDYVPLLQQLHRGGYRGDISCEVSSQVWRKPGYDSLAAARQCYRNISQAFRQAAVPRPA